MKTIVVTLYVVASLLAGAFAQHSHPATGDAEVMHSHHPTGDADGTPGLLRVTSATSPVSFATRKLGRPPQL